jgi:hypothetical protein
MVRGDVRSRCRIDDDHVDNVLEQALRVYEESERSLKTICQSVEQENHQLERQWKQLDTHRVHLIDEHRAVQQRLEQMRHEYQRLTEQQTLFDRQIDGIQQRWVFADDSGPRPTTDVRLSSRYEQVRSALKKVLSSSTSSSSHSPSASQSFPRLNLKMSPLDGEQDASGRASIVVTSPSAGGNKRKHSSMVDGQCQSTRPSDSSRRKRQHSPLSGSAPARVSK